MAATPFNQQAEATGIDKSSSIASVLLCSFLPSACRRQAKGEQSADCRPQPALPVGSSAGRARRKRVFPFQFRGNSPFAAQLLERE